jgi:hypothetical protein
MKRARGGSRRAAMGHNANRRSDDRVAEGAPLLREYVGKNLHRGFESLSLRQDTPPLTRIEMLLTRRRKILSR